MDRTKKWDIIICVLRRLPPRAEEAATGKIRRNQRHQLETYHKYFVPRYWYSTMACHTFANLAVEPVTFLGASASDLRQVPKEFLCPVCQLLALQNFDFPILYGWEVNLFLVIVH